jgi:hypothetical protein
MKAFALAVVATAGLLLSASPADAQWRSRGSYRTYSYPTYSYPAYGYSTSSYSTYSYPAVETVVAPTYYDNGVVVTSGYTPTYSPMVYPSGYTYPSSGFGSYSSYPMSGYGSGTFISPSGGYVGGRRVIRW